MQKNISIIIPAKNEAKNLSILLPKLKKLHPEITINIVNDGSTDNTVEICQKFKVNIISHPYSKGNGAAIKTGARSIKSDIIIFMDADGQHKPEDISCLLKKLDSGYDMVIGARSSSSQASLLRRIANGFYNKLASFMTGFKIDDLTSGFRAVKRDKFIKFLYLLPNGFSYPTTCTMAFFRSGFSVAYVPIIAAQREGKSHISLLKDGLKFLTIILKIGALFSPMRLFLPISSALFITGLSYYGYTFITEHRFTNMSGLLFSSSLIIFLMGILSEQISALHYKGMDQPSITIKDS
ncbi:MAG: glycosyltransferase family 2 protein [Pseudomonadota bacterium]